VSRLQAAAAVLLAGAAAGSVAGGVRVHDRAAVSDRELARTLEMRRQAQREAAAQALLRGRLTATEVALASLRRRAAAGDRRVLAAIASARRLRPRIVVVGAPRVVGARPLGSTR
jgi:hypothetical protein